MATSYYRKNNVENKNYIHCNITFVSNVLQVLDNFFNLIRLNTKFTTIMWDHPPTACVVSDLNYQLTIANMQDTDVVVYSFVVCMKVTVMHVILSLLFLSCLQ